MRIEMQAIGSNCVLFVKFDFISSLWIYNWMGCAISGDSKITWINNIVDHMKNKKLEENWSR